MECFENPELFRAFEARLKSGTVLRRKFEELTSA